MYRKRNVAAARPVNEPCKELKTGETLVKRYRILEKIGEGGFGIVYRAKDLKVRRMVAVKQLRVQNVPGVKERFEREAAVMRLVKHENIVGFHDYVHDPASGHFLVMEYVDGVQLDDLIKMYRNAGEPLDLPYVLDVMEQVLETVGFIHGKDIVHRDIKADNVIVVEHEGRPKIKLGDFGVAKVLGEGGPGLHARLTSRMLVMKDLCVIGSPESMAPEQFWTKTQGEITPATDIYALGVLLYLMLTGKPPFTADPFADRAVFNLLEQHLHAEPPDVRALRPDAPEALALAILKAMEKKQADRFLGTEEFLAVIREVRKGLPTEDQDLPEPDGAEPPRLVLPDEEPDAKPPEPIPDEEPAADADVPSVTDAQRALALEQWMRRRRRLAVLIALTAALIIAVILYVSSRFHL